MVLRTRRMLATAVSTLFAAEESTVEEVKEKNMSFAKASNLGFPRMGRQRELKFALEKYWRGELDEAALLSAAQGLRADHWRLQERLALKHRRRMTFRYMTMCLIRRLHSAQSRPGLNIMMALSI